MGHIIQQVKIEWPLYSSKKYYYLMGLLRCIAAMSSTNVSSSSTLLLCGSWSKRMLDTSDSSMYETERSGDDGEVGVTGTSSDTSESVILAIAAYWRAPIEEDDWNKGILPRCLFFLRDIT